MREEKAVSTALGIAILVAIVFLVILPLLLFLQNTAALYNLAVSERSRLELERMQERLEVHASISPEDHKLRILLLNNGPLTVNITRVYVMSDSLPTPERDLSDQVIISPSSGVTVLGPNQVNDMPEIEEGSEYFIDVTTSRGKTYSAPERPFNITDPPYILQITVLNMKYDRRYIVTVETANWGSAGERIGCVAGAQPCQPSVTMDYYSLRWNDNETFIFKLFPGNYTVKVTEYQWNNGLWIETDELGPEHILVLEDTSKILQFPYNPPMPINPESDLILILKLPETIMTNEKDVTINGNLIVGLLQTANEPLRKVRIEIKIVDSDQVDLDSTQITPEEIEISRILPGQAFVYNITIDTRLISNLAGGYITLRAELDSATGGRTGQEYTGITSEEQTTVICILTTIEDVPDVSCDYDTLYDTLGECISNCNCGSDCTKICLPVIVSLIPLDVDYYCCCRCTVDLGVIPRCGIPQ